MPQQPSRRAPLLLHMPHSSAIHPPEARVHHTRTLMPPIRKPPARPPTILNSPACSGRSMGSTKVMSAQGSCRAAAFFSSLG